MRVLYVAPYSPELPCGNSTALVRLTRHLARGHRASGEDFVATVAT